MKKLYTLLAAVLLTTTVWAQSPNKMSYQAVVRDATNELVSNSNIGMQISILQGSADGGSVYTETQSSTSNGNGLVSLEIGMGNTSDDFSAIDWSAGPYFIKTETDPTGGSNYTITGTSQLMSVPYALYAATSGSSTPGPQGEVGPQGPEGLDGTNGTDGSDGSAGPMGPIGLPGLAGATGAQGLTGAVGATGSAGADGADGAVGATGPTGTAGNDGATGAIGPQGPAGADGVGIAQTLSKSGNDITLSDGGGTVTITDNDTQLDAAGVAALGFTSGAHTTKYTDAEAVTAVGAHTIYTAGANIDITGNVITSSDADIESLQVITLLYGYINLGDGNTWQSPAFYKDRGRVYLTGILKSPSTNLNNTVFYLPVGYRPAAIRRFKVWAQDSSLSITIHPDGEVFAGGVSINYGFTLDGISFKAGN